jgi:hypothetical protein
MNEEIIIPEKKVSDSLKHLSEKEIFEMKRSGNIVYKLMKSDSGKYGKALDGTVYDLTGGQLKKIGRMNAEGKVVPISTMSKRDRSKAKRLAKRAGAIS